MATTLTTLTDRVETVLQDTSNAVWSTEDIAEAIRRVLARYNQVCPNRAITTKTLTAAGREISLSAVTGLINVERVWWDYDATDPEHPPRWRDFELWPGSILWINDTDEPQSGDVVRIWYTLAYVLSGLDSETSTTFPAKDDSLLVAGAAAFALQMRMREITEEHTIDGWPVERMKEQATLLITEFEAGLALLQRQEASRYSGIAPGPSLDRWDSEDDGWR